MRSTKLPPGGRLFCFPYAGGGASIYRSWQAQIGPSIRIHPIRLAGRDDRISERPAITVNELVEASVRQILPLTDVPFSLFGYSFGALLAFETARRLRRRGIIPDRLIVAALKAPHLPLARKPIHQLPDSQLADSIRGFCGTPAAVLENSELMNLLLPTIRADFTAYETYRYQPEEPIDCPISAMGGASDRSVSREELAAWGEHTSAAFTSHVFPGGHFFLNTAGQLLTWTIMQALLPSLRAAS
jgi:medium-chain acyl-[acyl-carrier-protein] hydrolase